MLDKKRSHQPSQKMATHQTLIVSFFFNADYTFPGLIPELNPHLPTSPSLSLNQVVICR
ncbi:MAG: hypothetical protein F6K28_36035 [Microcoleus sp. SIO2G3]|nr:hypothetical protein [Microcoleus sp. SIO2G3]